MVQVLTTLCRPWSCNSRLHSARRKQPTSPSSCHHARASTASNPNTPVDSSRPATRLPKRGPQPSDPDKSDGDPTNKRAPCLHLTIVPVNRESKPWRTTKPSAPGLDSPHFPPARAARPRLSHVATGHRRTAATALQVSECYSRRHSPNRDRQPHSRTALASHLALSR